VKGQLQNQHECTGSQQHICTKTKQASCDKYELWVSNSNNNKKQNLKQTEGNCIISIMMMVMIITQKILFD
jgi:hypothetical protein